jgi:hypothetical protein
MYRCDHKGDADFIGARNVLTKTRAALGRMDCPRGQKCPRFKKMFPDRQLSCPRTRRAGHRASSLETFPVSSRILKSYTSAPTMAHGAIVYQLDASFVQGCDQLHERVDVASDRIFARLHSLDRRKRQSRKLGEEALVHVEQRPRCSHLRGCDHA